MSSKQDIENILNNIRINCATLSMHHKKRHYYLKERIKWFKIPTIILSALNSVFSVGLQKYINQSTISITNCLISLVCGIIVSIEMYLNIEVNMRSEQDATKDYYLLSVDVQKYLLLDVSNREIEANVFLEKCYSQYVKLYENSGLVKKTIDDKLINIEDMMVNGSISSNSTASSSLSPPGILPLNLSFLNENNI